jgi:hypothetical protein
MPEISYTSLRISCTAELQNSIMAVDSKGPNSKICTVVMLAILRQRHFKWYGADRGSGLAKLFQIRNLTINLEE